MKVIQILISTLLSLILILNTLKVALTFTYYEIDPVGFIERLCENKDKPELQCNGKCHLKKITETEDSDNNIPAELIDFKEVVLYYQHQSSINFNTEELIIISKLRYINLYTFLHEDSDFHPPKTILIS